MRKGRDWKKESSFASLDAEDYAVRLRFIAETQESNYAKQRFAALFASWSSRLRKEEKEKEETTMRSKRDLSDNPCVAI